MTVWIIEPQDPLIVRDGRPFHATPGARARSLPFPFPSTTAGGIRTRAGQKEGLFDTSAKNIAAVKKIVVRGPLLVEQDEAKTWRFLAPAPADALVFDHEDEAEKIERKWLRPLTFPDGIDSNKPDELKYLVGLPKPDGRKPAKDAPAFWHWEQFKRWLTNPENETTPIKPSDFGHNGPQPDRRVHVGIDPATFTSLDGSLFTTSGLTFWQRQENGSLSNTKKLALAVEVNNSGSLTISEGFAPLGGERRLMNWQNAGKILKSLPKIPNGLLQTIEDNNGFCRLILLTPAYFKAGWLPGHFGNTPGATVTVQAAAVPNPVVVSGWDFEVRGPKATKRLAPAGSVYFIKVEGDVKQWVQDRWLHALSDDVELAKAGFGLTAVGNWDGTAPEFNMKEAENA